ncbi:S-adenosyl-L-methionine-dependent methyltransferase [Vararia minispora EC-137]|uniref:S-adenosyl-L-methionine-dependent methyltransferase n=1 Tax=Vararia minispora EC-137 TaxID=1314806 RepID=A0ACB8QLM7_9AGAM|nr:S-adenosyl-L-methionine-dependent methyltransferase [Vararia minispora EC-137]
MQNARFEKYYKTQAIVTDGEWNTLLEMCREPLPTTFRIAAGKENTQVLKSAVEKTYVPQLSNVIFEDETIGPPRPLPWYPGGLGWQFNVTKKVLRKSPEFKKFHSFLVFETDVGNITRQEAVSMLPPLFLDVQPQHKVMDMCAAPGSKTSQLLEFLHSSPNATAASIPKGLLIANDSDYKRTHLLIHQSARLPSPAMLVTNMDASNYPTLSLGISDDLSFLGRKKMKMKGLPPGSEPLLFDRILADVPCSGDGTIRKNVGIWKTWNPMDGNGLHSLQLRILLRAMRMLASGGQIVYSTCSLNPVENEAVIAEALRTVRDFELVDTSSQLPALSRRPGLMTWKPAADRSLNFFDTYEAYIESLPEGKRESARLARSHWPPPPGILESLHLERCMRIYPHLQDTGGFFVAVLRRKQKYQAPTLTPRAEKRAAGTLDDETKLSAKKPRLNNELGEDAVSEPPEEDSSEAAGKPLYSPEVISSNSAGDEDIVEDAYDQDADTSTAEHPKGSGDSSFKEMPYNYIPPDDPIITGCMTQASLVPEFPRHNILTRNPGGEPARALYLTNDLVRRVVQNNDFARIRLMIAGTKIFQKQEGFGKLKDSKGQSYIPPASQFRLISDGLPAVLPFIRKDSILEAKADALRVLVQDYYPLLIALPEEFRLLLGPKPLGTYVVHFKADVNGGGSLTCDIFLPILKFPASVSLMIDKKAKSALSLRVFGEDVTTAGREVLEKLRQKKVASQSVASSGVAPPAVAVDTTTDVEEGGNTKVESGPATTKIDTTNAE